ncbi:MAG TPA: MotA/TolQ/ExbB proton channel family protein [Candidatus Limnocylindrales bacterium]
MDAGIGIGLCLVVMLVADVLDGGSPAAFLNPSAILLIFGATFGATIASTSLKQFMTMPKLLGMSMKPRVSDMTTIREMLIKFAERARREGLLALESDVEGIQDPFIRHGLQMVIDGLEPDTVEDILTIEIESMQARHMKGIDMFAKMGGYSPTFGVLGTVMGLVSVLANLADPSGLGESIATAFIATLFGVGAANILWLPISANLKGKDAAEAKERHLALAAILAIQAGDNPRIVAQKLAAHAGPEAEAAPEKGASSSTVAEAA